MTKTEHKSFFVAGRSMCVLQIGVCSDRSSYKKSLKKSKKSGKFKSRIFFVNFFSSLIALLLSAFNLMDFIQTFLAPPLPAVS